MRTKNHMAVDQYGTTYHNLGAHPRKALMERTGYKHVSKMYIDYKDGSSSVIGYVVGPYWCRVFEITPWRKKL